MFFQQCSRRIHLKSCLDKQGNLWWKRFYWHCWNAGSCEDANPSQTSQTWLAFRPMSLTCSTHKIQWSTMWFMLRNNENYNETDEDESKVFPQAFLNNWIEVHDTSNIINGLFGHCGVNAFDYLIQVTMPNIYKEAVWLIFAPIIDNVPACRFLAIVLLKSFFTVNSDRGNLSIAYREKDTDIVNYYFM